MEYVFVFPEGNGDTLQLVIDVFRLELDLRTFLELIIVQVLPIGVLLTLQTTITILVVVSVLIIEHVHLLTHGHSLELEDFPDIPDTALKVVHGRERDWRLDTLH